MCKICPELLIKSREHCQWNCFGYTLIFVNNKQFSTLNLVFRFESEQVFIYLLNLKLRKKALNLTIVPSYGHTNVENPAANEEDSEGVHDQALGITEINENIW